MHNTALSPEEAKIISDYVLAGIRRNGRKTVTFQMAYQSVNQAKAAQQPTATRLQSLRDQIASLRQSQCCPAYPGRLPNQLDQLSRSRPNDVLTPNKRWFAQHSSWIAGLFVRLVARLCSLFARSCS